MHRSTRLAALVSLAAAAAGAQPAEPRRVAGEWIFRMAGDASPQRVVLTADGDSVRGSVYGQALAGTIDARGRLTFRVGEYRWSGLLTGDSLAGWLRIERDSSTWRARRIRTRAPRAVTFVPSEWHRELRTDVAPALRLVSGDTVRTTTVDALGWGTGAFGARGNKVTRGGNPATGPFVVDGALPGDVIAVTLLRVRLDRGWAISGSALMDNAIDASYARTRAPSDGPGRWVLDTIAGTARIESPSPRLSALRIPLRPFLGVVALAPGDGVVPSTRDSGPYGGNMEYAQLREGTTVHLPVGEEGAYLYLGDGHAAQGDGELTGDAMETTMDVAFTVELLRGRYAAGPRAENAEHLMSIGIAGSLDEALRRATSDMARWLERDYALTSPEAALVMGFALAFDVPDVVPPWVSVVARVRRDALPARAR